MYVETNNTKTHIRASSLLGTARSIIQKEGLRSLFKQFISLLFMYEAIVIVRKDLDSIEEIDPALSNYVLKIIYSKQELLWLIKNGFNIGSYFNIYELQRRLDQGEIIFAIFVNGLLVHKTCVLMYDTGTLDSPISIDWTKEAYVQFVETKPEYRGYHLYPYTLSKVFKYMREKGKSVCVSSSTIRNVSSIKAHLKAGYRISGKGRYIRVLLFLEFWKETCKL